MKQGIQNVLAQRYASPEMIDIWTEQGKVILERKFWIAVLKAQIDLGLAAPEGAVEAYEKVIEQVDLESINAREKVTRHDVKARIEEFNALAGYEVIHRGMTSRDLTDNVEQMQIRLALTLVRDRLVAVLVQLGQKARDYRLLAMAGRSHNVAAQVTTMGKRFASAGEELFQAFARIEELLDRYPLRGMKGPMGTSQDQLDLFEGDYMKLHGLEQAIADHLDFAQVMGSVGQVYPRSMDFEVVSALAQAAAGPASLARTIRLMAGYELATEGFKEGQVGSSAMPHKMNSRTSERIDGFYAILQGHVDMISRVAGDQWQEGDVSCSVVRRVVFPDAFLAFDGLVEALLTVLAEFGVYPAVINRELDRYMPFLSTTKLLAGSVKKGAGREEVHEAIKEHAVAVAREMREKGIDRNDLYFLLGTDARVPFEQGEIEELVGDPVSFIGEADVQADRFYQRTLRLAQQYPKAAAYQAGDIL